MKFNQQQQEIIKNITGAYLISAPVGTGKTTVLTERIITALDFGIKPEEVLCLTFTNRAADEMKQRIKRRINKKEIADEILVKTFHGFCAYFVKAENKYLGINSDFVIFDEDDQVEIMKEVLKNYPELIDQNSYNYKREILDLIEKLYENRMYKFMESIGCNVSNYKFDDSYKDISDKYLIILGEQNAVDFNELVMITLKALYNIDELKNKWSQKFKFIQLDEFQDTHLSEYLVIKQLARIHKNLSFIGDMDQTIYGWRGSEPLKIIKIFKDHFAPVQELYLETNYRFDSNLLGAIKSFLINIKDKYTKNIISHKEDVEKSKCIEVFSAYNFNEEIIWVIDQIKKIKEKNDINSSLNPKIAVLARSNFLIKEIAIVFSENQIEHLTVDKYDFFRRQEIRDVFAYLKIIFNKFDLESASRLVLRPSRNIGIETLKQIREEGDIIGLKVSDFLTMNNYNFNEPFDNLIKKWDKGRIIVLDTETTGTNTLKDEIIQIYATEVINGKIGKEFHYYIKSQKSVGDSYFVHGITDDFLEKKGNNIKKVLLELKDFINNDIISGHNINFDLMMIKENGKRNDINFEFKEYYDTLDLARRLIVSENYKLTTLANLLGLKTATHSADDDVRATVGLLEILIDKLRLGQEKRAELFGKFSKKFILIATLLNEWKNIVNKKRPAEALKYIWENSGLFEYYQKDINAEKRLDSIATLIDFFDKYDDVEKDSDLVIQELLRYASLVKNIDFLGLENGKIPIVTVHQVKGLEFDYVFIVGMNEFKFPMYKSDIEEEKRLFYVALTRAKKKVFLSYSNNDYQNRSITKSRFIDFISTEFVNVN